MTPCPCCGHAVEADPIDVLCRKLTPLRGAVVRALVGRPGRWTSGAQLADAVYRNAPGGGPDNATATIRHAVALARPVIAAHGWRIAARPGPAGGYRLEAMQ